MASENDLLIALIGGVPAMLTASGVLIKVILDKKAQLEKNREQVEKNHAMQKQVDQLSRENIDLHQQLGALVTSLAESDKEIASLRTSYDVLQAQYKTLQAQYTALQAQYDALKLENRQLREQLQGVKRQTGALKQQADAIEQQQGGCE